MESLYKVGISKMTLSKESKLVHTSKPIKYYISIKDQFDILIQIENLFKMLNRKQQLNMVKILVNKLDIK